ncbi:hypothetical protein [Streptomyces sp. KL116D]|uniref:hypothetical protein n=1 Tax=Streptomyces sp. KL116D TaxID=3045152 RepID=UPI00355908F9
MRYVPGLPDHEGSFWLGPRYNRAGSRTPMQWDAARRTPASPRRPRNGCTSRSGPGPAERRRQRADDGSLLHLVRRV